MIFLWTFLCVVVIADAFSVVPSSHGALLRKQKPLLLILASADDNDEYLDNLRRTVAQEDADWYREFVVDVLGEEFEAPPPPTQHADEEKDLLPKQELKIESQQQEHRDTVAVALLENNTKEKPEVSSKNVQCEAESSDAVEVETPPPPPAKELEAPSVEELPEPDVILKDSVSSEKVVHGEATSVEQTEEDDEKEKEHPEELVEEQPEMAAAITNPPMEDLVAKESIPPLKETFQQKNDDTSSSQGEETEKPNKVLSKKEEDHMVEYRDLYDKTLKRVPLPTLTALGFRVGEIPYLQPDALDLIVQEKIRKPAGGVPSHWMISRNQYKILSDDVRIVEKPPENEKPQPRQVKDEAVTDDSRSVENVEARSAGEQEPRKRKPQAQIEKRKSPPPDDLKRNGVESSGESRTRRTTPSSTRRTRPTRQQLEEGRRRTADMTKRIYTGRRRESQIPRGIMQNDRPKSKNKLWMDMDTFRDLLGAESEMRLRILGRDWSDAVREEANWRMNTYSKWLEMIDKGVGEPLFESRSDRERRKVRRPRTNYVEAEYNDRRPDDPSKNPRRNTERRDDGQRNNPDRRRRDSGTAATPRMKHSGDDRNRQQRPPQRRE